MTRFHPPPPYEDRRARAAVQVFERLYPGVDPDDDALAAAAVRAALNETYTETINDLDWEAAALRRLGYTGLVL